MKSIQANKFKPKNLLIKGRENYTYRKIEMAFAKALALLHLNSPELFLFPSTVRDEARRRFQFLLMVSDFFAY